MGRARSQGGKVLERPYLGRILFLLLAAMHKKRFERTSMGHVTAFGWDSRADWMPADDVGQWRAYRRLI